jgi:phytoene synthase
MQPATLEVSRLARSVMQKHARSFSSAARFLAPDARADVALLYAFARVADDLCDEDRLGPLADRLQTLADIGQSAERAQQGRPDGGDPIAAAAGEVLHRHGVPVQVLRHFLQGLRDDAHPRQLQTTDELLQFAFAVAGTVGQMMRPLLGAPVQAERHAIVLGMAMQLTNIARDVQEDAQRGRCYLPAQWNPAWRFDAALADAHQRAQVFPLVCRVLALADDFYAYAAQGLATIPSRNRRAVRVAAALYQGLGHKIIRGGASRYWQGRVSLGRLERSREILRMLLRGENRGAAAPLNAAANDFLRRLPLMTESPVRASL